MALSPALPSLVVAVVVCVTALPCWGAFWDEARAELPAAMREQADEVRSLGYKFDGELVTSWRQSLDPTVEASGVFAELADAGFANEALHLWVLQKISALRAKDFGRFGWHDYHQHPDRAAIADLLAGRSTPEEYYSRPLERILVLDIFDMVNALGDPASGRVRWLQDRRDLHIWSQWANLPETDRLNKTDYRNFEIFTSMAGRYWKTDDPAYRQALLRMQADFHRHHYEDFWRLYHEKEIDDKDVQAISQADWRSNTNALMEGWRLQNSLRQLAAIAKSSGPGKSQTWADVLAPVSASFPADLFPAEDAANFAWTLLGAARQYPEKLVWFIRSGAVPNQKMEALAALSNLESLLPENRNVSPFRDFITSETSTFITENFLPDGGMLEQSLNYNYNTRDNLENLARTGNPAAPLIQRENARFDAMLDSIRSPIGTLPQIGNNKLGDTGPASAQTGPASDSSAHPYSGYYAMRSGGSPEDAWLFFKNSRLQRGHLTRDNNGIQFTAFGRPLLVCGGPPDYELNSNPTVHAARAYFSEDSSLKANTILVDGHSQAARGKPLQAAPLDPIPSVWLDTPEVAVVDGAYEDGYGGVGLPDASAESPDVRHLRTVYLFKDSRASLVVDRMEPTGNARHRYTQIWKFPPVITTGKHALDGFHENEVTHDEKAAEIKTVDPDGANVTLLHEGAVRPRYSKFFGSSDPVLGWFAPGLSSAVPAVDYHASWEAAGPSELLTWIIPNAPGNTTAVERVNEKRIGDQLSSSVRLADGTTLSYSSADSEKDFFGVGIRSAEAVKVVRPDGMEFVVTSPGRVDGQPGVVRLLVEQDGEWKMREEGRPIVAPKLATRKVDGGLEVALDAGTPGARTFRVISGETTGTLPPGGKAVLQAGEGIAAWMQGAEDHPAVILNMPRAWPIPQASEAKPEGLQSGWLRKERAFSKAARLQDATLRTLGHAEETVTVPGLTTSSIKDRAAVFEGWVEIAEAGDYTLRLSGHRIASLSFRQGDMLLPPVLVSESDVPSEITIPLQRGFYPVVLTVGGFYGAVPKVSLEVSRTDSQQPLDLPVFSRDPQTETREP